MKVHDFQLIHFRFSRFEDAPLVLSAIRPHPPINQAPLPYENDSVIQTE